MSDVFCQVLRIGDYGSKVSGHELQEYLHYKQVVSEFPVSTISTRGRGVIYIVFQEQKRRSISVQINSVEFCFFFAIFALYIEYNCFCNVKSSVSSQPYWSSN